MSLQVDDSSRRGRSRSPSVRRLEEDRDRSRVRASVNIVDAVPYPYPDSADTTYYIDARGEVEYLSERDRDWERQRATSLYLPARYADVGAAEPDSPRHSRDSLRDRERGRRRKKHKRKKERLEEDLAYGRLPGPSKYAAPEEAPPPPPPPPAVTYVYAEPSGPWEYARPKEEWEEEWEEEEEDEDEDADEEEKVKDKEKEKEREKEPRYSATYLDPLGPGGGGRAGGRSPSPDPALPLKSAMKRDRSPQPPTARMSTLTVQTPHHGGPSAPASPLLEAYQGTYQSMSPMPSPMLLPAGGDAVSPLPSDDERAGLDKRRRRARFHDPVEDAARLAKALRGERRAPDTEPLIEILPGLTHEQVMELRAEYKRLVKTGTERRGVNVAKHIRARLKDEDPNLMKACYATALGRWESEAYWANFWYHGHKTRRELLIEALMGRTNDEIRRIKAGFRDKKYGHSLTRCMRTELREDKFKKAVLLVLDERRMEETDPHGRPLPIDYGLVDDDVRRLRDAVRSDRGGESQMLSIVTLRSDAHLREVLREYRERYKGANFAKDALKKSGNLVVGFFFFFFYIHKHSLTLDKQGEVLAHILNGVINKPLRDAMLLHHALTASRRDGLRRELLTARLVRYHWDPRHMALVRRAFREHYGAGVVELQDAVRDATDGEWGAFCAELCIARTPDDVRCVERVDIHG